MDRCAVDGGKPVVRNRRAARTYLPPALSHRSAIACLRVVGIIPIAVYNCPADITLGPLFAKLKQPRGMDNLLRKPGLCRSIDAGTAHRRGCYAIYGVQIEATIVVRRPAIRAAVAGCANVAQRTAAIPAGRQTLFFLECGKQHLGVKLIGLGRVSDNGTGAHITAIGKAGVWCVTSGIWRAEPFIGTNAACAELVEKGIDIVRGHSADIIEYGIVDHTILVEGKHLGALRTKRQGGAQHKCYKKEFPVRHGETSK